MSTALNSPKKIASNAVITAIGSYTPTRKLLNSDLEKLVDTSNEWIVQRTGIHERRIAAEEEFTSDLSFQAVRNMVDRYNVQIQDVDYIIVATSTPDTVFPSVASQIQARFGIGSCGTIDIQAACAGFTAAIQLANGLLLSGAFRKILIVGAETLSKISDYTDRTTCILFGDGAGAMLMEASNNGEGDVLASYSSTDGQLGHHVYCSSLSTTIDDHVLKQNSKLVQNGKEVYRWAVTHVAEGVKELLSCSSFTASSIDWFVPHNANARIIQALCERIGFSEEQTLSSIHHYGNTSAASIPLAIDDACRNGRLQKGQIMLLHGFGGGLTQAGVIIRWSLSQ